MDLSHAGYCKDCLEQWPKLVTPHDETKKISSALRLSARELRDQMVMTTEAALDIPITKRLGIVTAETVVGMNILKDVMLEVRDLVGGSSQTQKNAMRDIKRVLFDQMKDEAVDLGADMIVGVTLRFSDFGSRGTAILASAMGTAVTIENGSPPDSEINQLE